MRRSLKVAAGTAIASLIAASGASALQVIPAAQGIVDAVQKPLGADGAFFGSINGGTPEDNAIVGNSHWPLRPYLDKDAVNVGNNTITVHGTCGYWSGGKNVADGANAPKGGDVGPAENTRAMAGEITPIPMDARYYGSFFDPTALSVPFSILSADVLGEYPFGSVTPGPTSGWQDIAQVVPVWAYGNDTSLQALEFDASTLTIGPPFLPASHTVSHRGNKTTNSFVEDAKNDKFLEATLHPVQDDHGVRVTYQGFVEYLVYSDSYSTGPIDLDKAAINADGSFDIRLNTAGLAPDGYALRFLGCRNVSVSTTSGATDYRINYYQGVPNNSSGIYTNYNRAADSARLNNLNGWSSYVPTDRDGTGSGNAQQQVLGADVYHCRYPSTSSAWTTNVNGAVVAATNLNPTFLPTFGLYQRWINPPATRVFIPFVQYDNTFGPQAIVIGGAAGVDGRGPNEHGFSGVAPSGPISWLADNFDCHPYFVILPRRVVPLTSGYNGNTDFSCENRYNNTDALGTNVAPPGTPAVPGSNLADGGTAGTAGVGVVNGLGTGNGHGANATIGAPTGTNCPSGYDPVGIRANSNNDLFARFRVASTTAGSPAPAPAAPAFVAPTAAASASAASQATQSVISQSVASAAEAVPAAATSARTAIPAASLEVAVTQTAVAPVAVVPAGAAAPAAAATSGGAANTVIAVSADAPAAAAPVAATAAAAATVSPVAQQTVVTARTLTAAKTATVKAPVVKTVTKVVAKKTVVAKKPVAKKVTVGK